MILWKFIQKIHWILIDLVRVSHSVFIHFTHTIFPTFANRWWSTALSFGLFFFLFLIIYFLRWRHVCNTYMHLAANSKQPVQRSMINACGAACTFLSFSILKLKLWYSIPSKKSLPMRTFFAIQWNKIKERKAMAFGKIVIANCDSNYRYRSNEVTWYLRKFRRNNLDWKIEFKSKEMMMPLCVQFDANSFGWEFVWNWILNLLNDRFDRIGLILIRLRVRLNCPKRSKSP